MQMSNKYGPLNKCSTNPHFEGIQIHQMHHNTVEQVIINANEATEVPNKYVHYLQHNRRILEGTRQLLLLLALTFLHQTSCVFFAPF